MPAPPRPPTSAIPSTIAPAETDRICLTCHLNQPTHAGRILSSHAKNQVACTACHKIHANGPFGLVARKPAAVNELCAGCHVSVWAQFQKPYTHRLVQNAMSCVDCHNPHGSFRPGHDAVHFRRTSRDAFKCHSEVRGPFTFEHAPVRFEGCGTCHEAHGSANPRMLTRQDVRAGLPGLPRESAHQGTAVANAARVLGVVPPAFHDLALAAIPELLRVPSESSRQLRGQESAAMKCLVGFLTPRAAVRTGAGSNSCARRPSNG